jgi:hypothetical protein
MPDLRKMTARVKTDACRWITKVTGRNLANVDDSLYVPPVFVLAQEGTTMEERRFPSLSLCAPQKIPVPLSRTPVRTFDEILLCYAPHEVAAISSISESDFPTFSDSGDGRSVLRRRKTAFFQLEQLWSLAQQYRTGKQSMQEACALVTDATCHALNPSEKHAREYWEKHDIVWHRPPGRICATVAPEVDPVILELAGHIVKRGAKQMHAKLQPPQCDHLPWISDREVR